MQLVAVPFESTDISMLGYEPDTFTMQVQFANGSLYSYAGIEPETYQALLDGGNAYFHAVIKPQRLKYVYTRLV